ncbi:Maltose regulon regulatory protein MalI [compost metagenome]
MSRYSITIPDVAKAAGVSKSTVSLALQDSPKIKPETKRKVTKAAKELGYVYNRTAANLRRRSSEMIGMVINDLTNPFFAELAVALERCFTDSGYVVMMANTSEDTKQQEKVVRTFCEHGAAGILICPVFGTTKDHLSSHLAKGIPVVSVMRPIEGDECDFIGPDTLAGTSAATQHLIDQGITRLAFIGGQPETAVYQARLQGFMNTIDKAGINQETIEIIPCIPNRTAANETVAARIQRGSLPQGIVCYNDVVAFGVTFGLDRAGLKAGRDVAVIGFDDVEACTTFSPTLSSVHVYTDQLAKLAAECLMQRLKDPGRAISNQLVMPKIVIRESSRLTNSI